MHQKLRSATPVVFLLSLLTACGGLEGSLLALKFMKPKEQPGNTQQSGDASGTSSGAGKDASQTGGNALPGTNSTPVASPTPTSTPASTQSGAVTICNQPPRVAGEFKNIKYQTLSGVSDNLQSLDIYVPAISNSCIGAPVVIWVHGGGWMIGDKVNLDSKTEFYRSLGYILVSVNYRLSPDVRVDSSLSDSRVKFPDHPNDVGAAIAWVHKNISGYGGNPEKIALAGHSAGAHLVALVSTDQSYIRRADSTWKSSFLKCTGSYDTEGYDILTALAPASAPAPSQVLIYRNAFGDPTDVRSLASPKNHVSRESPAFQFARRGDLSRKEVLSAFSASVQNLGIVTSTIEASTLTHEEVNSSIGAAGDTVMTPFVRDFMTRVCFPK
jgi:acetyl esterase/lipase